MLDTSKILIRVINLSVRRKIPKLLCCCWRLGTFNKPLHIVSKLHETIDSILWAPKNKSHLRQSPQVKVHTSWHRHEHYKSQKTLNLGYSVIDQELTCSSHFWRSTLFHGKVALFVTLWYIGLLSKDGFKAITDALGGFCCKHEQSKTLSCV